MTNTFFLDDIDALIQCPVCHSEQAWEEAFLGELGSLTHWRCVACGIQWSERVDVPGGSCLLPDSIQRADA